MSAARDGQRYNCLRVFFFSACIAALTFLTGAANALTRAPMSESTVHIVVTRTTGGLRLTYRLSAAACQIAFGKDQESSPATRMLSETPGVVASATGIVASECTRRFSIVLRPDERRLDGFYPTLVEVGGRGFLLHLPAVTPDAQVYRTTVTYSLQPEDIVMSGVNARDDDLTGFVYVGPRNNVQEHRDFRLITPTRQGSSSLELVISRTSEILEFYGGKLGSPPKGPPVVVLAPTDGLEGWIGDLAANDVILLQVGAGEEGERDASANGMSHFLAHELFHLWNRPGFNFEAQRNGLWLLEGAAEYAAHLTSIALWDGADALDRQLSMHIPPCRTSLGADSLADLNDQRAVTTRYSCGLLANWMMDVGVRAASGGRADAFAVWRALFAAGSGAQPYDMETLRSVVRPYRSGLLAFETLLEGRGSDRWEVIFGALRTLTVEIEEIPASLEAYREAALLTLLSAACQSNRTEDAFGFEVRLDGLFLDPGPACATLGRSPRLIRINAYEIEDRWDKASVAWASIYSELQIACAQQGQMTLLLEQTSREHQSAQIRCDIPVRAVRREFRVSRALPRV
jgi:hypothetical protein